MSMSIDQAVANLKTMFPNINSDVIKLVLESNALNVDATVTALCGMNDSSTKTVPKMRLPHLYRKLDEYKLEMKNAAESQDFHTAAKRKDQIKAVEAAIKEDRELGHTMEELDAKIFLAEDGKAGFDFKYHSGGWDVTKISEKPGQPNLIPGDRIVAVGKASLKGIKYDQQKELWKKSAAEGSCFEATIVRFTDRNNLDDNDESKEKKETTGVNNDGKNAEASSAATRTEDVKEKKKHQANNQGSAGDTSARERKMIVAELNKGRVPDNFLRPPSYYTDGRNANARVQSQEEKDAQLARLLQDELFMEELRNNPDAYLDPAPRRRIRRNQGRPSGQRARTQASLFSGGRRRSNNNRGSAANAEPASPTSSNGDISGTGSAQPKTTFKERMSKLGASARERIAKMALFFKRKKKKKEKRRDDAMNPEAELVPLAEDLPQAPDIGGGEQSAFVIDSDNDDDLGMAAGEIVDSDENLVMDNLMREVHGDDANEAVAVELPGGDHNTRRRSGSRPELL